MPRAKKTKWRKTSLEWPTTSTASSVRRPHNDGTEAVAVDPSKSTESIESIEVFPVEAETPVENSDCKNMADDKMFGLVLSALPHEDRLIYRQVCREWKDTLDPDLNFGLLITDETQKTFQTLETGTLKPVSIKNIAVYNLHGPFKLPTGLRLEKDINVYIGMTLKMILASKFDQESLKAGQNAARLNTKIGNIPESASKENIYEVLKNVANATENLTIYVLAPTKLTEVGRDFFDNLRFNHLKSLECHIYESDLKAFHYGLFGLTFPNLTRAHFHYYVKPLAASMEDCFQLYAFIVKHKAKLVKLVLNDPPIPHHRRNPQGNHDLPSLNMEEIQLNSFELAISHREQYNHRTFDLKFITSQESLKFAKLAGVSLPETYKLLRKNATTLTEFHIRDFPGRRTLQRSKLFDCGSLETASNLKICCCHDFRLSNLQRLPSSIEHFTAVNFFDDKAPSLTLPADLKVLETRTAGLTPIQTMVIMPNSTEIVMMQRVNGVRKLYTNRRDKAGDRRAIQIQLPAISTTIKTAYTFLTHETFQQELLQIERSFEQERIRLRNEVSTTGLLDLPSKVQRKIYEKLPIEDRKICRLVNKEMRDQIEHVMQFGFWLNDSTLDWVQNTKLEIEWMAVSHLMTPLTPAKLSFLANVGDLVIEVHPDTFTIGTEADCNETPDLIYIPNKASSILESNLIKVLKSANKAFSLCLHRWALSCIKNYEKIDKLMADVGLPNLAELTVIITGNEIKAFCPLLKKIFPKLKEVNFKFFELPKTLTLTEYVDIFKFLINHKKNLRRLQLINPPLQPGDGDLNNAPAKLSQLSVKLVNEVMSLKIQTLTLKLLENLPATKSSSLIETLLENSSALVSLHCEGFWSCSVNKAVTRSAQTLTSLVVYGRNKSGVEMSSIMNLEKCTKLKNLVVKDFNKIIYIQKFPKSLVSLDLNCEEGVSSGDVAYISGLPNLEQVMIHNEERLPRSTYQAFLTNPKLRVVALTKHDKEMFKVLGRRDGSDIMFTDQCPSDLLTRADGEKDTKKHGSQSQQVNGQVTDELEKLAAFHVDHDSEQEQLQQNLFGISLPHTPRYSRRE